MIAPSRPLLQNRGGPTRFFSQLLVPRAASLGPPTWGSAEGRGQASRFGLNEDSAPGAGSQRGSLLREPLPRRDLYACRGSPVLGQLDAPPRLRPQSRSSTARLFSQLLLPWAALSRPSTCLWPLPLSFRKLPPVAPEGRRVGTRWRVGYVFAQGMNVVIAALNFLCCGFDPLALRHLVGDHPHSLGQKCTLRALAGTVMQWCCRGPSDAGVHCGRKDQFLKAYLEMLLRGAAGLSASLGLCRGFLATGRKAAGCSGTRLSLAAGKTLFAGPGGSGSLDDSGRMGLWLWTGFVIPLSLLPAPPWRGWGPHARRSRLVTVGELLLYFGAQFLMSVYMGWVMRTNATMPRGTEGNGHVLEADPVGRPAGLVLTVRQQVSFFAAVCIVFAVVHFTPYRYPSESTHCTFEAYSFVIFGCFFVWNIAQNIFSPGYISTAVDLVICSGLPPSGFLFQEVLALLGFCPDHQRKWKEILLMESGVFCASLLTEARIAVVGGGGEPSEHGSLSPGSLMCLMSRLGGSLNLAFAGVSGEDELNVYDIAAHLATQATSYLPPVVMLVELHMRTAGDLEVLRGGAHVPAGRAGRDDGAAPEAVERSSAAGRACEGYTCEGRQRSERTSVRGSLFSALYSALRGGSPRGGRLALLGLALPIGGVVFCTGRLLDVAPGMFSQCPPFRRPLLAVFWGVYEEARSLRHELFRLLGHACGEPLAAAVSPLVTKTGLRGPTVPATWQRDAPPKRGAFAGAAAAGAQAGALWQIGDRRGVDLRLAGRAWTRLQGLGLCDEELGGDVGLFLAGRPLAFGCAFRMVCASGAPASLLAAQRVFRASPPTAASESRWWDAWAGRAVENILWLAYEHRVVVLFFAPPEAHVAEASVMEMEENDFEEGAREVQRAALWGWRGAVLSRFLRRACSKAGAAAAAEGPPQRSCSRPGLTEPRSPPRAATAGAGAFGASWRVAVIYLHLSLRTLIGRACRWRLSTPPSTSAAAAAPAELRPAAVADGRGLASAAAWGRSAFLRRVARRRPRRSKSSVACPPPPSSGLCLRTGSLRWSFRHARAALLLGLSLCTGRTRAGSASRCATTPSGPSGGSAEQAGVHGGVAPSPTAACSAWLAVSGTPISAASRLGRRRGSATSARRPSAESLFGLGFSGGDVLRRGPVGPPCRGQRGPPRHAACMVAERGRDDRGPFGASTARRAAACGAQGEPPRGSLGGCRAGPLPWNAGTLRRGRGAGRGLRGRAGEPRERADGRPHHRGARAAGPAGLGRGQRGDRVLRERGGRDGVARQRCSVGGCAAAAYGPRAPQPHRGLRDRREPVGRLCASGPSGRAGGSHLPLGPPPSQLSGAAGRLRRPPRGRRRLRGPPRRQRLTALRGQGGRRAVAAPWAAAAAAGVAVLRAGGQPHGAPRPPPEQGAELLAVGGLSADALAAPRLRLAGLGRATGTVAPSPASVLRRRTPS